MTSTGRRIALAIAALAAALGACVVFFGPGIVSGDRILFSTEILRSDAWHHGLPLKAFLSRELSAGRLPFWCPDLGTGMSLLGEGQAGLLYPLHWPLFAGLPLTLAWNWAILLHVAWAFVAAAGWMRARGAGIAASVLAGVVFAFSGAMMSHVRHLNLLEAASWMPFLLWCIERLRQRGGRHWTVALALGSGMTWLAGHPQIALYDHLVAGAYAIWIGLDVRPDAPPDPVRQRVRRALPGLGGVTLALVCGVGLGAPQWLPTLAWGGQTARAQGLTFEESVEVDLHPSYLLLFVDPSSRGDAARLRRPDRTTGGGEDSDLPKGFERAEGNASFHWEVNGYVGLLALLLAALAFLPGRGRRAALGPGVLFLACLLVALGPWGGVARILHAVVPGFAYFRGHGRFLIFADLFLAGLAAHGLDRVLVQLRSYSPRLVPAVASVAVLGCFGDLFVRLADQNGAVAADRWLTPPETARWIAARSAPGVQPRIWTFDPDHLVFQNAYLRARGWSGDVAPYDPAMNLLEPNLPLLFGLASAGVYSPGAPARLDRALGILDRDPRSGSRWASLLGIRYVLSASPTLGRTYTPSTEFTGDMLLWPADARGGAYLVRVFENPGALPRALLARNARAIEVAIGPDGRTSHEALTPVVEALAGDFDPRSTIVVETTPGDPPLPPLPGPYSGTDPASGDRIEFIVLEPDHMELATHAAAATWLYVGDLAAPGWTATVDGRVAKIRPANLVGRAVYLEAGTHRIEMTYRAPGFRAGLVIASFGLAGLLLVPPLARRIRRRPIA